MQINATNLTALYKGYRTIFLNAYQANPGDLLHPQVAMRVPSMAAEEIYHWLGAIPGMRELLGEVVIKNVAAHKFAIANKEWEDTIAVKQTDIERDTYGIYNPLFGAMGDVARSHPDELLAEVLAGGFTTACYTGKNFFDTNHEPQKGKTKFSNKGTKKLSQTNFRDARAALKSVRNAAGRSMKNGTNLVLVVSPTYEATGREILTAEFIQGNAAAISNVDKGTATLKVMPELTAENEHAWFLLEVGKPVKPFIHQVEKEVALVSITEPNSDHVLKKHEFLYQGYGRYNLGYALPELAWGSTGADAA